MLANKFFWKVRRLYGSLIGRLAFYRKLRWASTLALLAIYIQTVQATSHIATYLIAFYLLHLLIAYFTPRNVQEEE